MIKKRNIGISIFFSIITFGFYSLYWFIKLTNEANYLSGEDSTSGGMALFFTIITCGLYSFFWSYSLGKKLYTAQIQRDINPSDNSLIFLLLNFFGLVVITYAIAQSDINKLLESTNASY